MNIKKIAAIAAVLTLATQNVNAQINKISCDYETGECRVQGSFNNISSKNAAATVLKPGKTVDDKDAYAYTAEIPVDDEGRFDARFKLNSISGEYMFRVGTDGQVFEKNFVFLNSTEIERYLKEINEATSAAELEQIFEKDYQRLKNICSVTIKPEDKSFVYNSLFEQIPKDGFKKFDELKYTIAQVVLLNDFMTETEQPVQKIEKLFEYFDDKYLPVIEIWNDSSLTADSIKINVCKSLQEKKINTLEELEKEFYEQTVTQALNAAVKSARGKELTIVKKVHSLMNLSQYNYFNTLGEDRQIAVLKSIDAASYTGTSNYAKGFDKAVTEYKNNQDKNNNNNNNNSSGPSGGGGNNGDFVYVPGDQKGQKNDTDTDKNFSDLENYDWAKPSIERLAGNDVISGRGNGIFDPGNNVKREEFTSMVIKALGLYDDSAAYNGFADVKPEDWFYKAVGSAQASGVIEGISDTEFGIGQNITRQDAVLICKRAAEKLGLSFENGDDSTHTSYEYAGTDTNAFSDKDDIAEYAKDAVEAMRKSGIVTGKSNNEFKPVDNMTRAEAAVVVDRLIKLIVTAKSTDDEKDMQMLEELKALGLYNGDEKGLSQELTRGEAADIMCSMMGIAKDNVGNYTFKDCTESNRYAKAVYAIASRGYLTRSDNEFRPDYSLEYNDAVRAAVIALGAGIILEHSDDENEYAKIASDKGILKDVKKTSGGYITKRDFIKLFYNMLDENIYLMKINGSETSYAENENETFLSNYHKIYKEKGKVTANARAGISGDSNCGSGQIKINGVLLYLTNTDYSDYIGREVDYYYKERSDGDYELIYMSQRQRTNTITLDSKQISSFKNLKYKYALDDNSNEKTLDITSKVNVIYNTKNIYDYTDEQLAPKSGTVTFVDADGDGKYTEEDTIIIKDYKNIVVNGANKSKNMIFDKYSPDEADGYTVDLSKIHEYTIKDKHGDNYGLSELREWDVVAAMISPDNDYAEFTLVDESYAGWVTSLSASDKKIKIDNNTYELSKDLRGDLSFVTPGKDVTVYWDLFGKVTAVREGIDPNAPTADSQDETNLSEKLAVLTAARYDEELDKNFIRSYYSDDKITTDYMADKVKLNGKTYKSDELVTALEAQFGKAVLIRLDSAGKVKEIITAALPGEDAYRGLWQINYPGESMLYKGDTKTFGNRFIAGNNIYTIPMNSDDYGNAAMFAYNNAMFRNDSSYAVDAYTTNVNGIRADAVVYKTAKNATATYDDDTGYVISDIKNGLNDDGEVVPIIDGYSYDYIAGTATAVSYELEKDTVIVDVEGNIRDDISVNDLEIGDCIRFGLNSGKINTIMMAYDYSEDKAAENTTRSGYTYEGYAYSMSDDRGYLSVTLGRHPKTLDINSYDNGGKYINSFWIRNASLVTVVDKTGKSTVVRNGSMSDILTYKVAGDSCSKVVLFSSWQSFITGIVVYVE